MLLTLDTAYEPGTGADLPWPTVVVPAGPGWAGRAMVVWPGSGDTGSPSPRTGA